MAKAKKTSLGLKARPSAQVLAKARKAGMKAKPPRKTGAAKTEASALRFTNNWNAWVDKVHAKAKEQAQKDASKTKLKNFNVAVAGL